MKLKKKKKKKNEKPDFPIPTANEFGFIRKEVISHTVQK